MSSEIKINLRDLDYSPNENPLLCPADVPIKKKKVWSGIPSKTLLDPSTGEITATSVVHQVEDKDDEHFVKVFSAGIAAAYELTRTGQRVFQAILQEYERSPMSRGYAEAVYLSWFDDGLSGQDIGMSEKTFQRGLKELLGKSFISPRSPNVFWVNPALFFKGDRFLLVKEYRRKSKESALRDPNTIDLLTGSTDKELT